MNPPIPKKGRKVIKVGAISYAHLIKELATGDMTCAELAEATGLHKLTVYQYCRELHAVGAVHIARYEADMRGRHNIKVYKLGEKRDAQRVRIPAKARQAQSRARKESAKLALVMAGKAQYVSSANGRKRFEMLEAA